MTQIWAKRSADAATAGTLPKSPRSSLPAQAVPPTQEEPKKEPSSPESSAMMDKQNVRKVLSSEDWDLILKGAKTLKIPKDTVILSQGEQYQRIFQITKGVCRIEVRC